MGDMRGCWQVWNPNTQNTTLQWLLCRMVVVVCESSSKALLFYLAWSKKTQCPDTGHIQIQHPDQSINMPSECSSSNSLSWQQPYWHKQGMMGKGMCVWRGLLCCWSVTEDIWVVTHLPLLQICVGLYSFCTSLLFADWIKKATLSSIVSHTLVTSQKLLAYCWNDSHRLLRLKHAERYLYWLAPVEPHPLQKDSIFSVNVEEKLAQTSSDLFQHCLWYFFPFCSGRDMQITKGTVSHLSWERWDQPNVKTFLFFFPLYLFFFFLSA